MKHLTITTAVLALLATGAAAQDLRIGLQDDADILDPDQSRTFVGRIVYTSLCDKLIDISPELDIVPELATEWSWSEDNTELTMKLREDATFHDGTPFNSAAVVANIDRSQNFEESRRKSEIASIEKVEAVDDYTVKFTLSQPDATLLAQLTDRAGMMLSPTAAEEMGVDFGLNPVCSGPYQFVERVQQGRMVLEKFPEHWNADEYHFETVTFLPIPDTTVRFANLQSGDLDMIERLSATDVAAAEAAEGIEVARATSLGYQGISSNVGNGERAQSPLGENPKVRQALNLVIDREALNQVVFNGAFRPGNQPVPPESPWYDQDHPVPERDVERAKELLAEAGYPDGLSIDVQVANNPVQLQVMQVIQSMAAEAGIKIEIQAKEFASMLADQTAGNYMATQVGWSGRTDPDGNLHQYVVTGGGINDSGYSNPEVDRLLNEARATNDMAERKEKYDAARDILNADLPIIYLYHPVWIWAYHDAIEGFTPYPDGMIRLAGVTMAE